jgi:RimJ/RimL family protein N-acetyltransferase
LLPSLDLSGDPVPAIEIEVTPFMTATRFDIQPILDGPRIRVRPLAAADFDDLFAVASDPELWALHPASDRYQLPVFRRLFEESMASGGTVVVIDKANETIIGSSRFRIPAPDAGKIEIGWSFLARAYWGGEFNAEVKSLLLAHAFRFVDIVYFRVGEDNLRSRRAMEKIGGQLTAERWSVEIPSGLRVVHVCFEIRRDNFYRSALSRNGRG